MKLHRTLQTVQIVECPANVGRRKRGRPLLQMLGALLRHRSQEEPPGHRAGEGHSFADIYTYIAIMMTFTIVCTWHVSGLPRCATVKLHRCLQTLQRRCPASIGRMQGRPFLQRLSALLRHRSQEEPPGRAGECHNLADMCIRMAMLSILSINSYHQYPRHVLRADATGCGSEGIGRKRTRVAISA